MTLSETERHFARVVDRVAHESVAAREDERLLDAGRVVADDVDDQLDVARVLDFSEEKMNSIKVINESGFCWKQRDFTHRSFSLTGFTST